MKQNIWCRKLFLRMCGGGGAVVVVGGVNVDALIHILCLTHTHIYTNSYIQMHLRVRSLSLFHPTVAHMHARS